MTDYGFGEQLASARRNAGLSIQQVSDALRIRNDIVRAIEMGDFSSMPAKAFSRNQVSAYARFLGLDSNAVTKSFLAAYGEFEREAIANASRVTNMQQPSNNRAYAEARKAMRAQNDADDRHRTHSSHSPSSSHSTGNPHGPGGSQGGQGGRGEAQDRPRRQGQQGGQRRPSSGGKQRPQSSQRRPRPNSGRAPQGSDPLRRRNPTRKQREISRGTGGRSLSSDGSLVSNILLSLDIKKVAIAVVAVIVVIVFISSVSRCGSGASPTPDLSGNGGSSTVQVTGGTDTSESPISTEQANAITAVPDIRSQSTTSFELVVDMSEGHSGWLQITTDDTTPVAQRVEGPQTFEYTVANSAKIEAGNPTYTTVKVNGKNVELPVNSDGVGALVLTRQEDGSVTSDGGAGQ